MTALYSSISGPPGGQDFELSRRLHHPDVRLVRTRLDEAGRPVAFSFSGDEYEANARALLADLPFYEVETERRVVRFGNIAQVFSAYEARTAPEGGELIKRGMNCAHLYHDGAPLVADAPHLGRRARGGGGAARGVRGLGGCWGLDPPRAKRGRGTPRSGVEG